jgi:ribosome-binding factor A
MSRTEKINELLKEELAFLISQNIPVDKGLITITDVDCSPDLNQAKVSVSVLPDKYYGTALKALRSFTSEFVREMSRKSRMRKVPKIFWAIDDSEKVGAEMREIIRRVSETDASRDE